MIINNQIPGDLGKPTPEKLSDSILPESPGALIKKIWKDRIKHIGDYRIDKFITNIALFSILGFLWYIAAFYNYNMDFFSCGAAPGESCLNPFYKFVSWKNSQYLPAGNYGTDLSKGPFKLAGPVAVCVLLGAFLINHIIYNRGKINLKQITENLNNEKKD